MHTQIATSNTGNSDLKGLLIKANGPQPVPSIDLVTVQDWSQESYQASAGPAHHCQSPAATGSAQRGYYSRHCLL